MSMIITTAIENLLDRTRSHLSVFDDRSLYRYLQSHWSVAELIQLLDNSDAEVVKTAATCLGIYGAPEASPALTTALGHEDIIVSTMAEFSLWTIWFAEKGPEAETRLRRVSNLKYGQAVDVLDSLIEQNPDWAEAYNQRAIVNYLNRCFISAIDDCREALTINPYHFGVLAGLGHALAQLGLFQEAARCYRDALRIHPRMEGIRQARRTVRNLLRKSQYA